MSLVDIRIHHLWLDARTLNEVPEAYTGNHIGRKRSRNLLDRLAP